MPDPTPDDTPARTEPNRAATTRRSVPLGRVFGVALEADWSVLIIFLLVLLNLGAGLLPTWHPDWSTLVTWGTALAAALLFFASILAHELSHAVVANRNGIPVRRITLFLFGGLAHMEGEPPSPRSEFLMAAVGPLVSLVIGFGSVALGSGLAGDDFAAQVGDDPEAAFGALGPLPTLLLWLGPVNVLLGLFNLVPGFPLDGGRVFRSIAWAATGDLRRATRWASNAGHLVAWALMAWGLLQLLAGGLLGGFWLLLIGWFLHTAARNGYQQLVVRENLEDVPLSELMRTRFRTVRPATTVDALVREDLMRSDQRGFPVVDDEGGLIGLVDIDDVRSVPQDRWSETEVGAIMTPRERLSTLEPGASAHAAFRALAAREVEQIPVLERNRPVGLVRSSDVMKWLSLHADGAPPA